MLREGQQLKNWQKPFFFVDVFRGEGDA